MESIVANNTVRSGSITGNTMFNNGTRDSGFGTRQYMFFIEADGMVISNNAFNSEFSTPVPQRAITIKSGSGNDTANNSVYPASFPLLGN